MSGISGGGGGGGGGFDHTTAFTVPGASAARSLDQRFGDIFNVRDFGAVGNGIHDDTSNIQAAITAATSQLGSDGIGNIYFPPCASNGYYLVTGTIKLPTSTTSGSSYVIRGDGAASSIRGNFAGYVFDDNFYGSGVFTNQVVTGTHSAGGTCTLTVSVTAAGIMTINVVTTGTLRLGDQLNIDNSHVFVQSLLSGTIGAVGSTYQLTSYYAATAVKVIEKLDIRNAFSLGGAIRIGNAVGATLISTCTIGADNGFTAALCPNGVVSSSFNVVIDACQFASPNPYVAGSTAVTICNNSTIRNIDCSHYDVAVRMYGYACNLLGGRLEVHNTAIMLGQSVDGTNYAMSEFSVDGITSESNLVFMNCQACGRGRVANIGVAANPGAGPGGASPQIGIHCLGGGSVQQVVFEGVNMGGVYTTAGIQIDNYTVGYNAFNVFNCVQSSSWIMPTVAASAQFRNSNNPAPIFTFANLPSAAGQVFAGDSYIISDGAASGGGTAAVSSIVQGAGTQTLEVTYNHVGTWTCTKVL